MYLRPVPAGQLLVNQEFDAPFQHVNVRVPAKHEGDMSTYQTICKPMYLENLTIHVPGELNHLQAALSLSQAC